MGKYSELVLGLICGTVLTFLNNSIVMDTLVQIFSLYHSTIENSITLFLITWSSRAIVILSFIGIIITIIYSIRILKTILRK